MGCKVPGVGLDQRGLCDLFFYGQTGWGGKIFSNEKQYRLQPDYNSIRKKKMHSYIHTSNDQL